MNYWNKPRFVPKTQENSLARKVPLVLSHNSALSCCLEVYENLVKVTPINYNNPQNTAPERTTNDIKNFSAKSRKRLFEKFNKLNYTEYGVPLFLSLTYHFDAPNNREDLKSILANFLRSLKRHFPPFHYIWKLEYQKRGAPHFHILLFPLNPSDKFYSKENENFIKEKWLKFKTCKCADCQAYSVKTISCFTRMMSVAYISKEIAKVQEIYLQHNLGLVWNCSNGMRLDPVTTIFCDLKYFNLIVEKKLQEKFKLQSQKDYVESLIDTSEPRSLFIDIHSIADELSLAKKNQTDFKANIKNLMLKKVKPDYQTQPVIDPDFEPLPDLIF